VATGVYAYLPLAGVASEAGADSREEFDRIGGQELMMPALQPQELWEKSGRYEAFARTCSR